MSPPTALRVGPIGTTNQTPGQYPTWQDYELMWDLKNLLGAGVANLAGGDFAVTQRGAGANLSVDVAAGNALVQITNTNLDGSTYKVPFFCGVVTNVLISAPDPTNPRIDIICLKVDVAQNPSVSAGNIGSIVSVTGTPAGSPAVPATPTNYLKLAEVAVAANAVSIVNANITDRRVAVNPLTNCLPGLALETEAVAIRNNSAFYATCTGSSNNYAATYSSLPSAPIAGLRVYAKANFGNTGASNFNYNSNGNVAIKKLMGTADVVSGDIPNNGEMELMYDGTYWQLLNPVGQASGSVVTGVTFYQRAASGSTYYSTASTSFTDLDATNVIGTVTTDANSIIEIGLMSAVDSGAGTPVVALDVTVDGTRQGLTSAGIQAGITSSSTPFCFVYKFKPGAGTNRVFKIQWKTTTGTARMGQTADVVFWVNKIQP